MALAVGQHEEDVKVRVIEWKKFLCHKHLPCI
jgi:hypothetical protein